MKKYLLITLVDGQQHELDLAPMLDIIMKAPNGPGLGILQASPNHPQYAFFCKDIATTGFFENPLDTRQPCWIAPSQIKKVEVVFDTMFSK